MTIAIESKPFQLGIARSPFPVREITQKYQNLNTNEKLVLLWGIYSELGQSIVPESVSRSRLQLTEGTIDQIRQMSHQEQLQVIRDLVNKVSNPLTRAYATLSVNTKLFFWYALAELVSQDESLPVSPANSHTESVTQLLSAIAKTRSKPTHYRPAQLCYGYGCWFCSRLVINFKY